MIDTAVFRSADEIFYTDPLELSLTACVIDEINDAGVLEILAHLENKAEFVSQVGIEKISVREVTRLKPSIDNPPTLN